MHVPVSSIPVLLVGPPGVGKTASVLAAYEYVEVLLASTLTEEDISGLPYREGDYDYRTIPALFRRLEEASKKGKTTALFLDELDKARRSVADTLLTLIASRKVGAATLPESTHILAAANPPELGGGDGISDAMISRFAVIDYIPNPISWAEWASTLFNSAPARSVICAVRQGLIPIFDLAGEGLAKRITSPRTLAHVLTIIERGEDSRLIAGLVTAGTASHIMHLLAHQDNSVLSAAVELRRSAAKRIATHPLRLA